MHTKHYNSVFKYTVGGLLFGLTFPLFALYVDGFLQSLPLTFNSIIKLHHYNVIHYVVDTAPFVLGIAGWILGRIYQKKKHINHQLQLINKSLDTLTYKITHDLRGPALNIKNLTTMLGPLIKQEEKQQLIWEKLNNSITGWLDTFEDFLELLKQEKTGLTNQTHCDIEQNLNELIESLSFEMQEAQAKITTNIESKLVYVSYDDLTSILKNLLTNAIKYAHADRSPHITICSTEEGDMLKITIQDNGIGIDLGKYKDKLFKMFERVHEKAGVNGSGIGLYLVKNQVERNEGTINVESIPNEGTIFTIHLPLDSRR